LATLLKNPDCKAQFFTKIDDNHYVFLQNDFIKIIDDIYYLNDSLTSFQNKIGLGLDGEPNNFLRQNSNVVLNWPFKDCYLEGGQTKDDVTGKEIFFNEVLQKQEITKLLEPKVFTNFENYVAEGTEVKKTNFNGFKRDENGLIKDNLLIKGNNLLALHSLVKEFRGKVKLIYIDPPYNTGNDSFGYNDKFNHSTWLTFMKNRLEIAKELLKEDGVIFVQIDDNEQAYLKVLMDEVFGRENFFGCISRATGTTTGQDANKIGSSLDYILIYGKCTNINLKGMELSKDDINRFNYKDNKGEYSLLQLRKTGNEDRREDRPNMYYGLISPEQKEIFPIGPSGYQSRWRFSLEKYNEYLKDDKIVWQKSRSGELIPYVKYYLEGRTKQISNLWLELDGNKKGSIELKNMFSSKVFSNPKPEALLERIIQISTQPQDIVLDFHAGSGTTAAVAHKMGRQWITIEQMDYIETITKERLKKVLAGEQGGVSKNQNWQGGGDFIYFELAKYNQTWVDEIIACKTIEDLWQLWKNMQQKSLIKYKVDVEKLNNLEADFKNLNLEQAKEIWLNTLEKNMLYVPLSYIDEEDYSVSELDKSLTKKFYKV
jgi:adenine-specific DNA-methyltransferase